MIAKLRLAVGVIGSQVAGLALLDPRGVEITMIGIESIDTSLETKKVGPALIDTPQDTRPIGREDSLRADE